MMLPLRALLVALLLPTTLVSIAFARPQEDAWPREVAGPRGVLVLYQPQPDLLSGNRVEGRMAFSLTLPGASAPAFGALWFESRLETDRDERTAVLWDLTLRRLQFADGDAPGAGAEEAVRELLPRDLALELDELESSLADADRNLPSLSEAAPEPPRILWVDFPATLVTVEGTPDLRSSNGFRVMRVIDTPAFLFLATEPGTYWLRGAEGWFTARNLTGSWSPGTPPSEVLDAALREAGSDAEGEPDVRRGTTPVVVTEPTVLISTSGEATYSPVPGTRLLYVANTDVDLFLEPSSGYHWLLAAGRWFRTDAPARGPWTAVAADDLPEDFARIPVDGPKAHVLAAVAGTDAAEAAVLDAAVPQTATIARDATVAVTYDGDPRFEPIAGTTLTWAVNSPYEVIGAADRYYCCHEAVWYEAPAPLGPWRVCVLVPEAIYGIPPACPLYRVRYVRVYHSTPTLVYVGYTPGYYGCFVFGPTVVYGTGWRYRPWYGRRYIPRPCTWGYPVVYRPYRGWSFGVGFFSGLWVRVSWGGWYFGHRHRPSHRQVYHRHPAWRPPVARPLPRVRRPIATRTRPPALRRNNVFVDRTGTPYRLDRDTWQRRTSGQWRNERPARQPAPRTAPRPAPTPRPTPRPTRPPTQRPPQQPSRPPTQRPPQQPTRPPTQRPPQQPTRPPTQRPPQQPTRPPTQRPPQPSKRTPPARAPKQDPTRGAVRPTAPEVRPQRRAPAVRPRLPELDRHREARLKGIDRTRQAPEPAPRTKPPARRPGRRDRE